MPASSTDLLELLLLLQLVQLLQQLELLLGRGNARDVQGHGRA